MTKRAYLLLTFVILCATPLLHAQESGSVFNFLSLPTSSHATALGGRNISLIEDDAALTFQNPALLSSVNDKTVGLNFLTFMRGTKSGSASYAQVAGERGTWGANVQFVGYGSMKETTLGGEVLGDMHALDMCVSGLYSYALGEVLDTYARCAIGQLGKLHYLSMTINCESPDHYVYVTLRQAADSMIAHGCVNAYTLDGGQTGSILIGGQLINPVQFGVERLVSDIFYFATAIPDT